jgi:DNA-binding CsgD family transcriptional regulator/PAS domain-containing protein
MFNFSSLTLRLRALISARGPRLVLLAQGTFSFYVCPLSNKNPAIGKRRAILVEQLRRIRTAECVLSNMQSVREYTALSGAEAAILSLMEFFPLGLVLVSQTGAIMAANRTARRILEPAEVLNTRNGILSLSSTPAGKKLRELTRVSRNGGTGGLRIPRPEGRSILAVGTPISRREGDLQGPAGAAAVIYISDEQPNLDIDPMVLAVLFGFTPAEAKVAVQMMQGHTVKDIAAKLGISPHTTRNHLKRLYAKTGTRKQCEFVHVMLTSPAGFVAAAPSGKCSDQDANAFRVRVGVRFGAGEG